MAFATTITSTTVIAAAAISAATVTVAILLALPRLALAGLRLGAALVGALRLAVTTVAIAISVLPLAIAIAAVAALMLTLRVGGCGIAGRNGCGCHNGGSVGSNGCRLTIGPALMTRTIALVPIARRPVPWRAVGPAVRALVWTLAVAALPCAGALARALARTRALATTSTTAATLLAALAVSLAWAILAAMTAGTPDVLHLDLDWRIHRRRCCIHRRSGCLGTDYRIGCRGLGRRHLDSWCF